MKKILLALTLVAASQVASATTANNITLSLVGAVNASGSITVSSYNGLSACSYSTVYFEVATIAERKAILAIALAAKLSGKTVRIDYTFGPGYCSGVGIYLE